MRKRIIFRNIFLSGLILFSGVSVVAVASCRTKDKGLVNSENPKESEEEKEVNLEDVLNSIEISFAKSKESSTVYQIEQNDLIFNNLDQKKYKITVEKLERDNEKQEILITYFITDSKTLQKSGTKTLSALGFKIEKNQDEIFKQERKNIKIEYPHKNLISPKAANKSNLIFSNYSKNVYKIKVLKIMQKSNSKTALIGSFIFENTLKNVKSQEFNFEIKGFKNSDFYDMEQKAKKDAKKIIVDIENRSEKVVNQIANKDLKIRGFDSKKYTVSINSLQKFEKEFRLIVNLNVKPIGSFFVIKHSINIWGFKNTGIKKEQFKAMSEKITFDYPNKEKIFALSPITIGGIISSGYDAEAVSISIISYKPEVKSSTLKIMYVLKDKKSINVSEKFEFIIKGFRSSDLLPAEIEKLNVVASKVRFTIKNVSEIDIKKTGLDNINIIYDNLPKEYGIQIFKKETNIPTYDYFTFHFVVFDKNGQRQLTSKVFTIKTVGFKQPQK